MTERLWRSRRRGLPACPAVLETWDELAAPMPSLTTTHADTSVDERLRSLGFVPAGRRPIAVLELAKAPLDLSAGNDAEFDIREVRVADELETFLGVLAAGYASPTPVQNFMTAEHSTHEIRRFIGWRRGLPMAAAAMSSHLNVAVLGGGAVLRDARGHGGQMQLLQHRLHEARLAGREALVATAAANSSSLRNLQDAGFHVTLRQTWRKSVPS